MILDSLIAAFPNQYIPLGEPVPQRAVGLKSESNQDHRFHWNRRGATIYVRKGTPTSPESDTTRFAEVTFPTATCYWTTLGMKLTGFVDILLSAETNTTSSNSRYKTLSES